MMNAVLDAGAGPPFYRCAELTPSRAAAIRRSSARSSLLYFAATVQDAQVRAATMGVRTDLNRRAYIHPAQPTAVAPDSLLTAGATRAFSVCL